MLKKYYDIIILSILWLSSTIGIIFSIIENTDISSQNYSGYGLLIIVTILRFLKSNYEKILLTVLLVIGSFNVIQFTQSTITTSVSWQPVESSTFSLGIQPLCFLLLIFLIVVKFNTIAPIIFQLFVEDPKLAKERQNAIINKRYNELVGESDEKLHDFIKNKTKYQIEYVKAAEKIIYERKNNSNL